MARELNRPLQDIHPGELLPSPIGIDQVLNLWGVLHGERAEREKRTDRVSEAETELYVTLTARLAYALTVGEIHVQENPS